MKSVFIHCETVPGDFVGGYSQGYEVTFDAKFWWPFPQYNSLSWNWPNRRLQQKEVCSCHSFIEMKCSFMRFPTHVIRSSLAEIIKIENTRIPLK